MEGALSKEGGLFRILTKRGGAYQRPGLNKAFTVCLSFTPDLT